MQRHEKASLLVLAGFIFMLGMAILVSNLLPWPGVN